MRVIALVVATLLPQSVQAAGLTDNPRPGDRLTGQWQVVRVVTTTICTGQAPCCDTAGPDRGLWALVFGRRHVTRHLLAGGARVTATERCRVRGDMLVSRSLAWNRAAEGTVGWTTYEFSDGALVLTVYEESAGPEGLSRETRVELRRVPGMGTD
jgi:hypothetical protein